MKKAIRVAIVIGLPWVTLIVLLYALSNLSVQAAPIRPARVEKSLGAPGDCTVMTTTDYVAGSLRQCILNLQPGATISFSTSVFPVDSPARISLIRALPDIVVDYVTIDGRNAGVILDGSALSTGSNGLVINGASGVTIQGLHILNFPTHGVALWNRASYNLIGGDAPDERNVISGNGTVSDWGCGIYIFGNGTTHNTISGNYIGTTTDGTAALGNHGGGIWIGNRAQYNTVGGGTDGERNLVSGNHGDGVHLYGSGTMSNTIRGNYIGADVYGAALGNTGNGLVVSEGATHNTIGGQRTGERNLIVANAKDGVLVWGGSDNVVIGNLVGTDASGTVDLGNHWQGVSVAFGSSRNRIERNVISRNGGEGGILIAHSTTLQNTITQNSIYDNDKSGIALWEGNLELFSPLFVQVSDLVVTGLAVPHSVVEIFSDHDGQGRWFHGSATTNARGYFVFTVTAPFTGTFVTATTTDQDGNTSRFSSSHEPAHDIVAAAIFVPQARHQIDMPMTPTAYVGNGGTAPETFTVTAVITRVRDGFRVYTATRTVTDLSLLHYRTLTFDTWTPTVLGDYVCEVHAQTPTPDDDPLNDRFTRTFQVVDERVDLWSKDNPADDGNEPSAGPVWQSADLWVRNAADGLTEPQDPINHTTNTVYVRVRNRGTLAATDATVEVYWHPPSLVIGQSWWQSIGSVTVPEIAPGQVQVVSMEWRPQISGVSTEPYHTCLIDVIRSAQDPAPAYWNVRASNNVEQRNVDVIPAAAMSAMQGASTPVSSVFSVGNPYASEQLVDVVVDATNVPDGSELRLDLGHLFHRWQTLGQDSLTAATIVTDTTWVSLSSQEQSVIGGLPLAGEELIELVLEVDGLNGRHAEIDIREFVGGKEMGGVSLRVVGTYEIFVPLVLQDQ